MRCSETVSGPKQAFRFSPLFARSGLALRLLPLLPERGPTSGLLLFARRGPKRKLRCYSCRRIWCTGAWRRQRSDASAYRRVVAAIAARYDSIGALLSFAS